MEPSELRAYLANPLAQADVLAREALAMCSALEAERARSAALAKAIIEAEWLGSDEYDDHGDRIGNRCPWCVAQYTPMREHDAECPVRLAREGSLLSFTLSRSQPPLRTWSIGRYQYAPSVRPPSP